MAACDDMRALILGAAEETLDPAGRARLARHVERCAGCRSALAVQTRVRRSLAEVGVPEVGDDFATRVRARVTPRASWIDLTNWRAWTLRLAPLAALLCLVALWPARRDASASSLSATVRSWASGDAIETQLVLDPAADAGALISVALGEPSR